MMINELKNKLDNLEKHNRLTKDKIANLFYNLEEVTNAFKKNIAFQNPFETLRVQISGKIFDCLDMKSMLTFRLSSKLGNTLILLLLQKQVNTLQKKKEKLQIEIQQFQKKNENTFNSQEANHLLEQFRKSDSTVIYELNVYDIWELIQFNNPSQLVVKILEVFTILLDCTKRVSWSYSRYLLGKILDSPHIYIMALLKYDVTSISEQQLNQLQQIHQINIQPQQISLRALRVIYQYIMAIVKLRESKQIQILSKLKRIEKLIGYLDRKINILQKFLN